LVCVIYVNPISVKETTDLHDIIHSLSMSEKRYISLSIMHQGDNTYLKLFRAIAKQKEFDESELRQVLKNEKFIERLPKIKYFLYNFILRKLTSYYWSRNPDTFLNELFIEVDILYKKNLYGQARKRMLKLKALAEENEEYELLLQCHRWERRFSINTSYKPRTARDRDAYLQQELDLIKKVELLSRYSALSDKFFIYIKTNGEIRKKADIEKVQEFLHDPLMNIEPEKLPPPVKILFHHLHLQFHYYLQDYDKALEHIEKYLSALKPKISSNESTLKRYIKGLTNKALILGRYGRYANAFATLEKMHNTIDGLAKKNQLSEETIKSLNTGVYELEAELYMQSGQYSKIINMIPVIEEFMNKYEGKLELEYVLFFNYIIACTQLIVGNFKQSILYLNRILNHTKGEITLREDLYCYCKIVYLIAHYEAGTEGLPDYLIKSTYRFLAQRNRLYKVETAILTFIKNKLLKNFKPAALTHSLQELKDNIVAITADPYEKKILEYFDFVSWLEGKISGRPFMEVIAEAQNKMKQN
jgi:hypothetical protein